MFEGTNLLDLGEREMRAIRGDRIAMIFQEPMTSLNPVLTIGHQISEAVRIHRRAGKSAARERAREVLELVKISDAARRLDDYPHQFSGGMRQRVMIAMALACDPKLLITHDLGVVAETCQRVIVMYAGRKVEEASVLELFDHPAHPYTRGLMASVARGKAGGRLNEIPGIVPSLREPIVGCSFAPRCPLADDHCRSVEPRLAPVEDRSHHVSACHKAKEVAGE